MALLLLSVSCKAEPSNATLGKKFDDGELRVHLDSELKRLRGLSAKDVEDARLRRIISSLQADSTIEDLAKLIEKETQGLLSDHLNALEALLGPEPSPSSRRTFVVCEKARMLLSSLELTAQELQGDFGKASDERKSEILTATAEVQEALGEFTSPEEVIWQDIGETPALVSVAILAVARAGALHAVGSSAESVKFVAEVLAWIAKVRLRSTLLSIRMYDSAVTYLTNAVVSWKWFKGSGIDAVAQSIPTLVSINPKMLVVSECRGYIHAARKAPRTAAESCDELLKKYGAKKVEDWLQAVSTAYDAEAEAVKMLLTALDSLPSDAMTWSRKDFVAAARAAENDYTKRMLRELVSNVCAIQLDSLKVLTVLRWRSTNDSDAIKSTLDHFTERRDHLIVKHEGNGAAFLVNEEIVKLYNLSGRSAAQEIENK
ncbi:MAG: hypothetical protein KF696_13980 [Planctomycetes bacterium]|nr:hypothetical protein [Planctomycetota bacterium]MCW8136896.1 hypothetical protein [Planctomycetota bacterium]